MIVLLESKIRNYYDTSIKTTNMRLARSRVSVPVLMCQWNRSPNIASPDEKSGLFWGEAQLELNSTLRLPSLGEPLHYG